MARHWNTHTIRPYPNQETPPGKPDVLFFLPEVTGKMDVLFEIFAERDVALYLWSPVFGKSCVVTHQIA